MTRPVRREPRRVDGRDGRRHDGRRRSDHVRQSSWATVREEVVPDVFDEDLSL